MGNGCMMMFHPILSNYQTSACALIEVHEYRRFKTIQPRFRVGQETRELQTGSRKAVLK